MKHKPHLCFSLLALLSLLLSGAAVFQLGPEPPEPRPEREAGAPAFEREDLQQELDLKGPAALARSKAAPTLDAPQAPGTVTPGAPGLSFRYLRTIGITGVPYETGVGEDDYINNPEGIDIGADGKLYVAEKEGARVLRYDSFQHADLVLGSAGNHGTDDDHFNWPNDVLAESDGDFWVADSERITRFSSAGDVERVFPEYEDITGECDPLVDMFCDPYGLAMDSAGRLYVSDYEFHVVKVFTLPTGDTPVYSTTIGIAGESGDDNAHFAYPIHIAIDSNDNLYVAEEENHRIQKCSYSGGWNCTTFHGVTGEAGDDEEHLSYPYAATPYGSTLYIADTDNWRVKACDLNTGVCNSSFITDIDTPTDVAVGAGGDLFISQTGRSYIVSRYNSSGVYQEDYAGAYWEPYDPDPDKIYGPYGLAVDSSGNLYSNERRGNRYLKYNSVGALVGSIGEAGISRNLPTHFTGALMGNPAVSAGGLLYLPDTNRHCVKIYDLNFTYQNATLGSCNSSGDSSTLFRNVGGVAVSPVNGNIYVVDRGNNKVKIYNNSWTYLGLLGQGFPTGYGDGNYQFDYPIGIAVDKLGAIYVADRNNHRVQKYNSSGVFQYRIGITDTCDWYYDTLCAPTGLATDGLNRVYIAENWNDRVQVYDSAGAYLTTIGGSGGTGNEDLRYPTGVAVAKDGTVYVADHNNHRIQVYVPGVPFWSQTNLNGFANPNNGNLLALGEFQGTLFAGTYNSDTPGELWRLIAPKTWSRVTGFGSPDTLTAEAMVEFKGDFYVGTAESTGSDTWVPGLWRSDDGLSWTDIVTQTLYDSYNGELTHMAVFSNTLFAFPYRYQNVGGAEIWKTTSGDKGDWHLAAPNGFGDLNNEGVFASAVFSDCLYAGASSWNHNTQSSTGAEVWVTCDADDWDQVNLDGFGDSDNRYVTAMGVFEGKLYVSTAYAGSSVGANLWRCEKCDGSDWEHLEDNGLGNPQNDGGAAMVVKDGWLYWGISGSGGAVVFRTQDGENWEQIGFSGFGDANNNWLFFSQSMVVYHDSLYVATENWANGGEIWQFQDKNIFLPLLKR